MIPVRITRPCGDYAPGDIVEMIDRRAVGLVNTGYAEMIREPRTASMPGGQTAAVRHGAGSPGRDGGRRKEQR